jgi:peroxiredoxin
LKEKLQSQFTFLSDPDGVLLDALNIRHKGGREDGADIAFPTAVLVDGAGTVRWTYQSDTYRQRAEPEEVFAAIEAL